MPFCWIGRKNMEANVTPRQNRILLSLVKEFIDSAEPVGSSYLARKYGISSSPATIRNEMAKLESMGYLQQPHASSGRVPSDKAYRHYVNYLIEQKVTTPEDVKRILAEFRSYNAHIQRLLERASKLLANFTHYTSLVLAPRLRKSLFKYLKLVPADGRRIIIILVTNTGTILNKVIQLENEVSEEDLEKMTNLLNQRLSGMYLGEINLNFLLSLQAGLQKEILEELSEVTREVVTSDESHFIYDGAANLLDTPEFHDLERLKTVLALLEEERVVAEILNKTLNNEGVKVYIGTELDLDIAQECTFITAAYTLNGIPLGSVGIIGPTRMPYQRLIPAIGSFAEVFSEKLNTISNI